MPQVLPALQQEWNSSVAWSQNEAASTFLRFSEYDKYECEVWTPVRHFNGQVIQEVSPSLIGSTRPFTQSYFIDLSEYWSWDYDLTPNLHRYCKGRLVEWHSMEAFAFSTLNSTSQCKETMGVEDWSNIDSYVYRFLQCLALY